MHIRPEAEEDHKAVFTVNASAFGSSAEAGLVDALRQQARPAISLVAEDHGEIIGHIMFTPVTLSGHPDSKMMGLAPMAVSPENQRQGIGSTLIEKGLEQCKKHGITAVVVLGHPEYYPRFGFTPSCQFGIISEYDVPDNVFMVLELIPDALKGKKGTVHFHDAFNTL